MNNKYDKKINDNSTDKSGQQYLMSSTFGYNQGIDSNLNM